MRPGKSGCACVKRWHQVSIKIGIGCMRFRALLMSIMATVAVVALAGAPAASANPSVAPLGTQQELTAPTGNIAAWTVSDLRTSADQLPAPLAGELWEATATVEAVRGDVTPVISDLNARAANGQNYRALFNVATPQGINPSILRQGMRSTGKVYFDVTGQEPNSVVYNDGVQDLLIWTTP